MNGCGHGHGHHPPVVPGHPLRSVGKLPRARAAIRQRPLVVAHRPGQDNRGTAPSFFVYPPASLGHLASRFLTQHRPLPMTPEWSRSPASSGSLSPIAQRYGCLWPDKGPRGRRRKVHAVSPRFPFWTQLSISTCSAPRYAGRCIHVDPKTSRCPPKGERLSGRHPASTSATAATIFKARKA